MGNFSNVVSNYVNGDLTVGSKLKMPTNTANKILVADGTSFEEVDMSGDATIASSLDLNTPGDGNLFWHTRLATGYTFLEDN